MIVRIIAHNSLWFDQSRTFSFFFSNIFTYSISSNKRHVFYLFRTTFNATFNQRITVIPSNCSFHGGIYKSLKSFLKGLFPPIITRIYCTSTWPTDHKHQGCWCLLYVTHATDKKSVLLLLSIIYRTWPSRSDTWESLSENTTAVGQDIGVNVK